MASPFADQLDRVCLLKYICLPADTLEKLVMKHVMLREKIFIHSKDKKHYITGTYITQNTYSLMCESEETVHGIDDSIVKTHSKHYNINGNPYVLTLFEGEYNELNRWVTKVDTP